jgi:ferredoxin-type protein NapF
MRNATSTRRNFLTGSALRPDAGPFPPGATAISLRDCTGCGACFDACPSGIISIRSGIPVVDLKKGECTFCGRCAERCPERVFPPDPVKHFPHHATVGDGCLAVNFVDCQACRDSCPSAAIGFAPRIGGPFVPHIDAEACTGCGACLSVCPTRSIVMSTRVEEPVHA